MFFVKKFKGEKRKKVLKRQQQKKKKKKKLETEILKAIKNQ